MKEFLKTILGYVLLPYYVVAALVMVVIEKRRKKRERELFYSKIREREMTEWHTRQMLNNTKFK